MVLYVRDKIRDQVMYRARFQLWSKASDKERIFGHEISEHLLRVVGNQILGQVTNEILWGQG